MSTDIFNTSMLSAEPARYVVIAEACLPGIIFLIMAWWMRSGYGDIYPKVYGAPRGAFEVLTHLVMVALWTIGLVVAACNLSSTALCVVAATSMLALVFGFLWLWMYVGNIHMNWKMFLGEEKGREHDGGAHRKTFLTKDANFCPEECQWPNLCLYIAFLGILTSAITSGANGATEQARLACAGMLTPVAGWFSFMLMLTYMSTSKCDIKEKKGM
jgi:hypothetical protein